MTEETAREGTFEQEGDRAASCESAFKETEARQDGMQQFWFRSLCVLCRVHLFCSLVCFLQTRCRAALAQRIRGFDWRCVALPPCGSSHADEPLVPAPFLLCLRTCLIGSLLVPWPLWNARCAGQVESQTDVLEDVNMVSSTRLGCVGCRLLMCVGMRADGVILKLGTQSDSDRLQDRSTGGRGGGSLHGVLPRPVVRRELMGGPGKGPGTKRASDPVTHCAHGEGAAGNRSLDDPGFFGTPLLSGTPFHRSMSMLPETPTQPPGQQSRFVLRAPPRPSGLNSADDCSLDVHQIWRHWERCMHFSPQQLLQCITEVGLCHGFDPFLVAAIVRDHAMGSTGLRMRRRRPTCRRMRPRLIWIITA